MLSVMIKTNFILALSEKKNKINLKKEEKKKFIVEYF
jgi:hypothetical protein